MLLVELLVGATVSDNLGRCCAITSSPNRVKGNGGDAFSDGALVAVVAAGSMTVTLLATSSFSCQSRSRSSGLRGRILRGRVLLPSLSSFTSFPNATFFTCTVTMLNATVHKETTNNQMIKTFRVRSSLEFMVDAIVELHSVPTE